VKEQQAGDHQTAADPIADVGIYGAPVPNNLRCWSVFMLFHLRFSSEERHAIVRFG
jgi:hypothetical protein